ncbi:MULTISPECIES: low molecular weight phosphatase family protein [unclassified Microbacterium]|uniref:arsenate-mycothiol transferase ArsC n=1 Tax=unclassified Microbacterium TaxID=2609290 RepID=UPI001604F511|nr:MULTISPECIES: low molecular weight phosphatase family protein [unclassified Microbacterium]QNA91471.1 low molecular weight phosphatase family protein [Microbacterium sp. Se63.02b]QYM64644.1 low molecular weight phosphatase family protein [Microbacterium sp. Se5.02b]
MTHPKTVLFICKHNAGRSQLGAHLLGHIGDGRLVATSAGITPAETINPAVAASLHELGIDTSAARPRAVTVDDLNASDVVVLMKPGLPLPGAVRGELVEWSFPDPSNWEADGVRELRDAIDAKVRGLAARLVS